ncbi:MAG TPA: hypothetical protein VGN23_15290 [Verrucomicrobiae bacterium]|jgi:hypothetical protein
MKASQLDDCRRLVLPQEFPANSAVTIQELDEDTLIIRKQRPRDQLLVVLDPDIKSLPDDPAWEKKERALADHAWKNLPEPKD